MKTSDILTLAIGIQKKNGWTQDDFWDSDPKDNDTNPPKRECPVCALGAINIAGGHDPDDTLTGERLQAAQALGVHLGFPLEELVDHELVVEAVGNGWNDAADRTFAQVLGAMHAAAEAEREAGR